MKLLDRILDLIFPPRCVFCNELMAPGTETNICADCAGRLPLISQASQSLYGDFYTICVTPFFYQEPVESSILRYKFHGRSWYSRVYGPFLRDCLRKQLPQAPDLITWAPLSTLRYCKRGYNQAELLAREAGSLYGIKPVRLLRKTKHTKAQSKLSAAARKKNAEGVYRALKGKNITGKQILLVDDVLTTGSTLSSCARALIEAGAGEVICLTLARSISAKGSL